MAADLNTSSGSIKASWAEQVENETALPPTHETIKDNIKTITEYKRNEDGQKVKIVSTFKIEIKKVPKPIAERKKLKKFGAAAPDPPGPNPSNTMPSEEIKIQFVRNRAGELNLDPTDLDDVEKLKRTGAGVMKCRFCKQTDHWSVNCPYKEWLAGEEEGQEDVAMPTATDAERDQKMKEGKYIPVNMRPGAQARGISITDPRGKDENTVRVTNLPEDTTDQDLRELFQGIGRVTRIFLAKDKATGRSKGFAFVTYEHRSEAEKAIQTISGHRYDYVILKVEWARPNN